MNIGDIILIPFPFAELTNRKVRPAVVIAETNDKYRDLGKLSMKELTEFKSILIEMVK
jgi:hypothetical protein